ncbi:ethanolamine utilization protein EutJ [Tissierella sp. P1]|jgi:branched-chain amino acid transport system substrate-binding protein|uniref:ABC transporter substrate-binding protein n=1 Tax=Tissierella TaxID=41273 RepID=UPI000BA0E8DE|nr:ABC transporter substrate-binding protein [Tissierella sp. P1]MDU5083437.1 ABC transporter substrate-binding protein [Bacillota bacterium]OZV10724.1 ethanolamine utilization protein EutJ [Tissierella sp. P1]
MNKKLLGVLSLVLILSLLAGCTSKPASNQANSDTIKVGVNYELSGDVATYGQNLSDGVLLAIEEINKNGGVLGKQIQPIKVDNKSEDTESANVSTRLVTRDKVVALLGPATSGNTKAAIPAATQNKIPLISASATADDVTVDSNGNVREYVFKTCFSDSFQGVMMAEFALKDLGFKNAAILADSTSDYAKGLSKAFKETFTSQGGKVLTEEAYQAKDTDFKAVLTNLKGLNPEVLFVPGYYEEVGLIVRQARELGLNVPILGADGYESPKLTEIAGKDVLNQVYYSSHYSPMDEAEEVVKFKENFKAKYGKEADAFNALGYDLGYFLKDALERAGEVNSEKLKDAIASTKDFKGVTGTVSIDEKHNPVKSVTIIEMKDGVPTFLKKLDPK